MDYMDYKEALFWMCVQHCSDNDNIFYDSSIWANEYAFKQLRINNGDTVKSVQERLGY